MDLLMDMSYAEMQYLDKMAVIGSPRQSEITYYLGVILEGNSGRNFCCSLEFPEWGARNLEWGASVGY